MLKFKSLMWTAPILLVLVFGGVTKAKAQGVSAYLGFGTATDGSNNQPLEPLGAQDLNGNTITHPDIGPKLTGLFGTFGADFMWKEHLGFGGEYSWRVRQGPFAPQEGFTYRPAFYDFNAIYHPLAKGKRVVPELQGGLGGVNTKFYFSQTGCVFGSVACQTLSQYVSSSNHFQLHFAGGVRFYVKGGIYLRPQFDGRWVHNFVEFGSDFVPQYSVAIGYTFGEH
jgi:hypothetical protein